MTSSMLWRRLGMVALAGGVMTLAWAGWRGAARGDAVRPPAAPMTQPTTEKSGPEVPDGHTAVRRSSLAVVLDLPGVFVPVSPQEVRIRVKRYQGDYVIKNAAAPGTKVAKGDVLLQLETDKIDLQVAAAENDVIAADAAQAKAQAEMTLGQQADDQAMEATKFELANAQTELKRWDGKDGLAFALNAGVDTKIGDYYYNNENEELKQLQKMYKSEDLTSATADIVVKRAIAILDIYTDLDQVSHITTERMIDIQGAIIKHRLSEAVDSATLSVAQLQASQAQGRVVRDTSLFTAKAAADEAHKKLAELKQDRAQFSVAATLDGVVEYGSFDHKAWHEIDAPKMAAGEKVLAEQVLLTVYVPGKLRLVTACPESQVALLAPGAKLRITPAAMSDTSIEGTIAAIAMIGQGQAPQETFDVTVDLPATDARLLPGYDADVFFDAGTLDNVLVVPATAVWHGRVWVKKGTDKAAIDEPRFVVVGRSNGESTEIKSGLTEGELVLTTAKHPGGQ